MSKKHKTVCRVLNYIEQFFVLISTVTRYVSISVFASLVGIPIGIKSSPIGLNICVITARNKNYKLIIDKRKKKHDIMLPLAKSKINSVEFLISKALIDF